MPIHDGFGNGHARGDHRRCGPGGAVVAAREDAGASRVLVEDPHLAVVGGYSLDVEVQSVVRQARYLIARRPGAARIGVIIQRPAVAAAGPEDPDFTALILCGGNSPAIEIGIEAGAVRQLYRSRPALSVGRGLIEDVISGVVCTASRPDAGISHATREEQVVGTVRGFQKTRVAVVSCTCSELGGEADFNGMGRSGCIRGKSTRRRGLGTTQQDRCDNDGEYELRQLLDRHRTFSWYE